MAEPQRVPRTLLLTWWAHDAPYKVICRIAERFPADRIRYATLWPEQSPATFSFAHKSFAPRQPHWRLRKTALGYWYANDAQAARTARRIAEWTAPFQPEVVWVVAELAAVHVGYHLHRRLNVPLHVTVQDAHECARFSVPPLYFPVYMRRVHRLLRCAGSVDAISGGMLEHLEARYPNITDNNSMVFHPSVERDLMSLGRTSPAPDMTGKVRRLGLCGSMRVSEAQWDRFLALLAQLPYEFEIIAYANPDCFHASHPPPNVRLLPQPYAPTERDVVTGLLQHGVHACHLGLWKEKEKSLFPRTSLSAKMITYAAAGLPIVVDGPGASAAWRLVDRYGAGVLCEDDDRASVKALTRLFGDSECRERMAEGARDMCSREFDLLRNTRLLQSLLAGSEGRAHPL